MQSLPMKHDSTGIVTVKIPEARARKQEGDCCAADDVPISCLLYNGFSSSSRSCILGYCEVYLDSLISTVFSAVGV